MFDTVQSVVTRARSLLLDETAPYRYSDTEIVAALNIALLEARRLRPDLMRSTFRSGITELTISDNFTVEDMYKPAFIYYIVGHVQMRDDEDVSDSRAASFMKMFTAKLLSATA